MHARGRNLVANFTLTIDRNSMNMLPVLAELIRRRAATEGDMDGLFLAAKAAKTGNVQVAFGWNGSLHNSAAVAVSIPLPIPLPDAKNSAVGRAYAALIKP
jgi:hypothetical protein